MTRFGAFWSDAITLGRIASTGRTGLRLTSSHRSMLLLPGSIARTPDDALPSSFETTYRMLARAYRGGGIPGRVNRIMTIT